MLTELELGSLPFFEGIEEERLIPLAEFSAIQHVEAGAEIFREGQPAEHFYVVLEGRVGLQIHSAGTGDSAIATIRPGEALGWSWLFPPYRWHFDARALDPVRLLSLEGAKLRDQCDRDHHLGYAMLYRIAEIITQRLQSTRLQLLDVFSAQPAPRAHQE